MSALLSLGRHVFEVAPLNYNRLRQQSDYRVATIGLLGRPVSKQKIGQGDTKITISGLIFENEFGGWEDYRAVERTMGSGTDIMVVGGLGHVFGRFIITSVSEAHKHIGPGGMPAMLSFDINVERYNTSSVGISGIPSIVRRLF